VAAPRPGPLRGLGGSRHRAGLAPRPLGASALRCLGAFLPNHPFDVVYNHGLRHLLGTRPLPRSRAPRRFACAVATVWLTPTGLAFFAGATTVGYVLGAAFVLAALVPTLTDFCIPSFFYGLLFGKRGACPWDAR